MGTKEKLINATVDIFSKKGYSMTLKDVAQKVNIKVPSIYNHFDSKDDIIYTSIKEELKRQHNYFISFFNSLEDKPSKVILKEIFFSIIDKFESKDIVFFWKSIDSIDNLELKNKCQSLMSKNTNHFSNKLDKVFKKGYKNNTIKKKNIKGQKTLYLSMIYGIITDILITESYTIDDDLKNEVWITFWQGIKA